MTGFAGADRRQWWGFTDLGPIQIPPNPMYMILTDRVTGQFWWVSFTLTAGQVPPFGTGHVTISTNLPADIPIDRPTHSQIDPRPFIYNNCYLYGAYDEPIIGFWDSVNFARLAVSNGALGAFPEQLEQGRSNYNQPPPLYVIQAYLNVANPTIGYNGEYVQIVLAPGSSPTNPTFTWIAFALTQTPNPPNVNSAANLNSGGKKDV